MLVQFLLDCDEGLGNSSLKGEFCCGFFFFWSIDLQLGMILVLGLGHKVELMVVRWLLRQGRRSDCTWSSLRKPFG